MGDYVRGDTPTEISDLAGNVAEWTLDEYSSNHNNAPIDGSPRCTLAECAGTFSRVTKGGDLSNINVYLRSYMRVEEAQTVQSHRIGGRFVRAPIQAP